MKFRLFVVAVALVAAVASANAAETLLTNPTDDGCELYMPYVWIDLAPGQTWSVDVNLSQCSTLDLGWFRYYGHDATNRQFDTLRVRDGIVLKTQDMTTKESCTPTATQGKEEVYCMVEVDQPTRIHLTATNTSNKTKHVRMTWVSMSK